MAQVLGEMYIFMYIMVMAKRCSVADARKDLSALLTQAEAGVEVEITRRGEPVAVLVSIQKYQRIKGRRSAFKQAYKEFAASYDLGKDGLDEDFLQTLRDASGGRRVQF
ncbi:MAG: type II toxin-antitoxin system Phd/YefM family antitoxin [Proteobacteria bacterium]|nr:type II toxin-antitoxin system Phd/YefM family antitoxin [Pseudomonadota bacterium]